MSPRCKRSSPSIMSVSACGRSGCHSKVLNGMLCELCNRWYHKRCTGLSAIQYTSLQNSQHPLVCMSCLYISNTHVLPKQTSIGETQTSESIHIPGSICPVMHVYKDNSTQTENECNQLILPDLEQLTRTLGHCISSVKDLNVTIQSSNSIKAINQTVAISDEIIRDAAADISDQRLRSCNVIIRGLRMHNADPLKTSKLIMASIKNCVEDLTIIRASWIRPKNDSLSHPLLIVLKSSSAAVAVIDRSRDLKLIFKDIRSITPDFTLAQRQKHRLSLVKQNVDVATAISKVNHHNNMDFPVSSYADKLIKSPRVLITPLSSSWNNFLQKEKKLCVPVLRSPTKTDSSNYLTPISYKPPIMSFIENAVTPLRQYLSSTGSNEPIKAISGKSCGRISLPKVSKNGLVPPLRKPPIIYKLLQPPLLPLPLVKTQERSPKHGRHSKQRKFKSKIRGHPLLTGAPSTFHSKPYQQAPLLPMEWINAITIPQLLSGNPFFQQTQRMF